MRMVWKPNCLSMNCPYCKNPTQENAVECEWCGNKFKSKNDSIKKNPNVDEVILSMLKKGHALNAVNYKKAHSNLNLKESKDYVDRLAQKNGLAEKGGCFIATACYGDYESPEVIEFRRYRDDVLLKSYLGRHFVSTYYFISPPFANLLSKSEIAKSIIRELVLFPILNLIRKK
jgi:hypothetical protein